jgi:hypothetical protein
MARMAERWSVAALAGLTLAATAHTQPAASVGTDDLITLRKILVASHPAFVAEPFDAAFHGWLDHGFNHSLARMREVRSADEADTVLQWFVTGFEDPHLRLAHTPTNAVPRWAGFDIGRRGDAHLVVHRASDWPVPLPKLGARLLSCDDIAVADLLARVGEYTDRRQNLAMAERVRAALLTSRVKTWPLPAAPFKRCTFKADGLPFTLDVRWQDDDEGLRHHFPPVDRAPGLRRFDEGHIVWVDARSFSIDVQDARLQAVLAELRNVPSTEVVVLDLRGNGGGDSAVGFEVLRALLKSDMPPMPAMRTRWRVSPLAVQTLSTHASAVSRTDASPTSRWIGELHAAMRQALADGKPWIDDHGVSEDPTPIAGAPFRGPLLLLTDEHCASACLTFLDLALRHPQTLQVGHETGADTFYSDTAAVPLGNGRSLVLPLKVYLGRARQPNRPWVPRHVFAGSMDDEVALIAWIRGLLHSSGLASTGPVLGSAGAGKNEASQ